jgi:hypothetical protein
MTEIDDKNEEAFAAIKESITDSSKDWQVQLLSKYQNLRNVCNDNLPGLWDSLEFELSIQKIFNIADCTLPFAGIVLGRPSSLKTVGIELFRKWHSVFYTDSFSAKSMVSHSTAVKKEKLAKIDMLPKIKNKFLLTPELSPTFAKKDDDLIEILGILTRILDGHGYESDTGAHGHRGYNEPIMFVWAGAAVDIPYKVHKYLGTLGPKLYFLRLPSNSHSEADYYNNLDKDFGDKLDKIRVALFDYLQWFEYCPDVIDDLDGEMNRKSDLQKMRWAFKKNEELPKRYIIKLAILLSHLRGVVTTWGDTSDSQGLDYAYALAIVEDPSRAITQLMNLARGHALSQGRNYITLQDIPLVIKVVFSTASHERVRIFELLIEHQGKLSTSIITESLNTSNNTAKRTMAEFRAVGLVNLRNVKTPTETGGAVVEKQITLKDDFDWFLSDDFLAVRNLSPYSSAPLPPYYSEGEYPVRMEIELEGQGQGGSFSYNEISSFPPKCYRCDFSHYETKKEYEYHCVIRHPGQPGYPGLADIKESGLSPQGMSWEI